MSTNFLDLFASQDPYSKLDQSNGVPSIGEVKSDMINFYNIASGKAKAADWGAGIGAGVGAFVGGPQGAQVGANIGKTVLPFLNKTVKPVLESVAGGFKDMVGK